MSSGLKQLKGEVIRLESTQIRLFSGWPSREAGPCERWLKDTQN